MRMARKARNIGPKGRAKARKTMREFSKGTLRHGSKGGPVVRDPQVAKAIAMSQARKVSRATKRRTSSKRS